MNYIKRQPFIRALLRDPLVLPFYIPSFVIYLGYGLIGPILPLYAEDFGVSYAWVGAVASAEALGMLLTDLPCGFLLRYLGQKRAMVIGIGMMILTRLGLTWAGSIQEVFVYRLIAGFAMALYGVARHAYISEQASSGNRGRAMALYGGLNRIGKFIGPLAGGYIASATGLRVPFLVSGIISLPAVACVLLFVREPGARAAVASSGGGAVQPRSARGARGKVTVRTLLREQAALLAPAGVGQIFAQMIRSGRDTIIPLYAANMIGLDVGQVGLMMGIAAAVEMMMFLPAGWVMDTMGRKYSIVPSFALQALGMALVPLSGGFAGLLACTSLIGLANGLSSGAMMTLGADLAPDHARGEFLGVWRLIGDIGGTGGPAAVGVVADLLALPSAALTLAAAGVVAALVFGLLLPETLQRETASVSSCAGG